MDQVLGIGFIRWQVKMFGIEFKDQSLVFGNDKMEGES